MPKRARQPQPHLISRTKFNPDNPIDPRDPVSWCAYNEYLFTENRRILNGNQSSPIREILAGASQFEHVHFYDTESGEAKKAGRAVEEMENTDNDCRLTAYFHYFVAKQNRKRAYEMFGKWRENVTDYLDQRSDYKEGQYLKKSDEQMKKVNENDKALKFMDAIGWWDKRIAGAKVYKSVCSDPAFFK